MNNLSLECVLSFIQIPEFKATFQTFQIPWTRFCTPAYFLCQMSPIVVILKKYYNFPGEPLWLGAIMSLFLLQTEDAKHCIRLKRNKKGCSLMQLAKSEIMWFLFVNECLLKERARRYFKLRLLCNRWWKSALFWWVTLTLSFHFLKERNCIVYTCFGALV